MANEPRELSGDGVRNLVRALARVLLAPHTEPPHKHGLYGTNPAHHSHTQEDRWERGSAYEMMQGASPIPSWEERLVDDISRGRVQALQERPLGFREKLDDRAPRLAEALRRIELAAHILRHGEYDRW